MISVIIPVYNIKQYIEQCVRSATAQSFTDIEIILVDDGSTDGSGKICDRLALEDGRIKCVHSENRGLSAARNLGLKTSSGEYIYYLDGDDFIEPGTLSRLYDALAETGADFACGGTVCDYPDGSRIDLSAGNDFILSPAEFVCGVAGRRRGCVVNAWNKLYRREIALGNLYPEGLNFEDQASFVKLAALCKSIAVAAYPCYHYRIFRSGSICSVKSPEKLLELRRACNIALADMEKYFPDTGICRRQYRVRSAYTVFTECCRYENACGSDSRVTELMRESTEIIAKGDCSFLSRRQRLFCSLVKLSPSLAKAVFICIQSR